MPRIKGAKGAGGPAWGRRSLGTWLVRERIAAVVALVVAGGALTLVLTRNTQHATMADLASEPVRTFEVAAADSPSPPPVAAQDLRSEEVAAPPANSRVALTPAAPGRGVASAREADAGPAPPLLQQSPTATADVASAATDNSLRSVTVATAQRAEAREGSAEAAPTVAEKVAAGLGRRRSTEESKSFSETRPVGPVAGAAVGAAAPTEGPRLVQEERMTESGGDVRRRIYRVEDLLVTLDERPRGAGLEAARAAAANAARSDSTAPMLTSPVLTFIRWTDASGAEFDPHRGRAAGTARADQEASGVLKETRTEERGSGYRLSHSLRATPRSSFLVLHL